MKKVNDSISTERINEYLRIRGEQYLEKRKKGMTAIQENEFYSNIMEIISIIDYSGITLDINNNTMMCKIREDHYNKIRKVL